MLKTYLGCKMKKKYQLFLVLLLCLMMVSCNSKSYTNEIITKKINYEQNISIRDLEDALITASEIGEASIVGIQSENYVQSSFGSGVIINKTEANNIYIYTVLTNFHVISYKNKVSSNVSVFLGKFNETIDGVVLQYDKILDVAFIKFSSSRLLEVATIGDSTNYKKGSFAIAIGNPYDLESFYDSVTIGNVSANNRLYDDGEGYINYYIQHTAPINSGNSGGGLFNIYGELMGINNWKFAEEEIEGMGFAIPIHIIEEKYGEFFGKK